MQLDYRLTTEDYRAFNAHVARTSVAFTGPAARQRIVMTVLTALVLVAVWGVGVGDWAFAVVAAVLGALSVWLLHPVLVRRRVGTARELPR